MLEGLRAPELHNRYLACKHAGSAKSLECSLECSRIEAINIPRIAGGIITIDFILFIGICQFL